MIVIKKTIMHFGGLSYGYSFQWFVYSSILEERNYCLPWDLNEPTFFLAAALWCLSKLSSWETTKNAETAVCELFIFKCFGHTEDDIFTINTFHKGHFLCLTTD